MNDTNISIRQKKVLEIINQSDGLSRQEVESQLKEQYPVSKPTLIRDINNLKKQKLIIGKEKGKNSMYISAESNILLRYFDIQTYFLIDPDNRLSGRKTFNFKIFNLLQDLIPLREQKELQKNYRSFSKTTQNLQKEILKKELERFIIELSWKSSKIEGNTYSLLDTERLIKESIKAEDHPREEAFMILNHKYAFETIVKHRSYFTRLTVTKMNQLHNLMVKNMSITTGIRTQAVGITGTVYKPLDNQWQLKEAMGKLVEVINSIPHPLEKAFVMNSMISYIQPYSDGNKRTGRMLANAILLAHDYFPLSYRSIDETIFKKALILFYEQNSIYHLKKLFLDQYLFALNTYFR